MVIFFVESGRGRLTVQDNNYAYNRETGSKVDLPVIVLR